MSKGLSQMSGSERRAAIERRLRENHGGLGTLAALDAKAKYGVKKETENALPTSERTDNA